MKVALFVTCLNDTMFPATGQATVALLRRLGVDVDFPKAQTCCGQMHVNSGYVPEAIPVVRAFVEAFAGYDAVVTPSGSCAASARHQHKIVAQRSGDPTLISGSRSSHHGSTSSASSWSTCWVWWMSGLTSLIASPCTPPATQLGCWEWATAASGSWGRFVGSRWLTCRRLRSAAGSVERSR